MRCSICTKQLFAGDHCYVLTFCIVMEGENVERRDDAQTICIACIERLKLDQPREKAR